mgnify:CR=1 FL=1
MTLTPLPAFSDNYIWMLHDGSQAVVVDPGDAQPVTAALQQHGLQLAAILVTHHHPDHTGGVDTLRDATGAAVYGPARERMPEPITRLCGGDACEVLGLRFMVIDVPGHTAGHIAYFCDGVDGAPLLFCGDTLFSGGCGRLFEGTPAQMHASLSKLAALPADTRVCCTHEYTMSNLRFAAAVEPGNAELAITVGSTHRDMPHTYGVSYFSSKGPTGDGRMKPDLVAPGEKILSCDSSRSVGNATDAAPSTVARYREDSGTSMAAPHVSGAIAAFLSIRREFIGQAEVVRRILQAISPKR